MPIIPVNHVCATSIRPSAVTTRRWLGTSRALTCMVNTREEVCASTASTIRRALTANSANRDTIDHLALLSTRLVSVRDVDATPSSQLGTVKQALVAVSVVPSSQVSTATDAMSDTLAIHAVLRVDVTSTAPRVSSASQPEASVPASQTSTDPTVRSVELVITTSQNADHVIVMALGRSVVTVTSEQDSAVVGQTSVAVTVANVLLATTTIQLANHATVMPMAARQKSAILIMDNVSVSRTLVDHGVTDVQLDTTDIHSVHHVDAARLECRAMNAMLLVSVCVSTTSWAGRATSVLLGFIAIRNVWPATVTRTAHMGCHVTKLPDSVLVCQHLMV